MKHRLLLCFLLSLPTSVIAQEVVIDTNYYVPPIARRRVLTADPDQNPNPYESDKTRQRRIKTELLNQFNETQVWYAAVEGTLRGDGSVLSNSFNGLVGSSGKTTGSAGVLMGYTYRNAWVVETGVTYAPVHLNITIQSSPTPYVFNYQTIGYNIPLRIKRRIGSGSKGQNGTGFWVSAGAWLLPNGNNQPDALHFTGRSGYGRRAPVDTLLLSINTTTANRISGLAELGIEYATRLSSSLELAFSLRKYWGMGNALRSDMVYTVNGASETKSTLTANGSGWGLGIGLRYIYARQHELKKR
ncbi:hypothetical protein [Spirosoma spitsbergense]|uniref:hypothetical protein n=1 Tax=Spirosoma spitsbergense TaxID=431554 RepID=UPI00037D4E52|nr:hypothetical protein [Spirosoma spitsbergense]